jgi:UDP-N-acetylmuramoyl-tripeptide--D-alanyl-D-alanine ligase
MPISYRPTLWTRDELLAICNGRQVRGDTKTFTVSGVSRRPQTAEPGDVFFATAEGGDAPHLAWIPELVRRGITACVVSGPLPAETPSFARIIEVPSAHEAMIALGHAGRARTRAKVVGVTGSFGKTGVKDAIAHVMSRQCVAYSNFRNDNCGWGVPGALAGVPEDCGVAVFEMGMLARGSIRGKSLKIRPHVGVITAIGAAHLYKHQTLDSIVDTKSEIAEGLEPGAIQILPRDSEHFPRLHELARAARNVDRVLSFGAHPEADVRVVDAAVHATHSRATFGLPDGTQVEGVVALPGAHWVTNAACVLAVVHALGGDVARAAMDLSTLVPSFRRGERFRVEVSPGVVVELVDDTWNASPSSVRAALAHMANMQPAKGGRRVAILGDMLELGPTEAELHAALAANAVESGVDVVHTVGKRMTHLREALPRELRGAHWADAKQAASQVAKLVRHGDVVLVKGSNGTDMYRVVTAIFPARGTATSVSMHWRVADELDPRSE